jgi:large subunit ribosomal protein L13
MNKKIVAKTKASHHEIDAAGLALGRVASRAAFLLRGKARADFERHLVSPVSVTIINAGQIKLAAKKQRQKAYVRYTGYPGGLRRESLGHLIERRGWEEPLRRAVRGMLPANKLRAHWLKNLTIKD